MNEADDFGLLDGIVINLAADEPTAPLELPTGTARTAVGKRPKPDEVCPHCGQRVK